tara:strand:- start:260 stop:1222 length:963 start_codon:yes stop_codon:yes gene_type:complete
MKKIFAILTGEPKSINSEIIAKSWKLIKNKQKKNIFLIGNFLLIKKQLNSLKLKIPLTKINNIKNINSEKKLQILNVPLKFKNPFKIKENENSKYVLKCLNIANNLAKKNLITGFINCPIDKKKTFREKNLGVTEYLSRKNNLKNKEIMMIFNKKLSVVPITTHTNIKNIVKKININNITNKINSLNKSYYKLFKKKPTIIVLGLNPHNAELRKDSEESKVIIPVIKKLKRKKLKISGPYPADTVFLNIKNFKNKVIVGMYHDQVLAPFKALFKFDAINITLGLKYTRVSPDHGTAQDIIGLKKANPLSLIRSIEFFSNI